VIRLKKKRIDTSGKTLFEHEVEMDQEWQEFFNRRQEKIEEYDKEIE